MSALRRHPLASLAIFFSAFFLSTGALFGQMPSAPQLAPDPNAVAGSPEKLALARARQSVE